MTADAATSPRFGTDTVELRARLLWDLTFEQHGTEVMLENPAGEPVAVLWTRGGLTAHQATTLLLALAQHLTGTLEAADAHPVQSPTAPAENPGGYGRWAVAYHRRLTSRHPPQPGRPRRWHRRPGGGRGVAAWHRVEPEPDGKTPPLPPPPLPPFPAG